MARKGEVWRLVAVMAVALLLVGAVLWAVGLSLPKNTEVVDAAKITGVFAFILAASTQVMVPLLAWWRRSRFAAAPTTADVARAKDVLAGLVGQQWHTEALLRSLDDPAPIPVQWRLTRNEQEMNHHATTASLQLSGASDQIAVLVGEFRRMRRRRLVVLGGPGAGKTTLAVQLLLALLSPRHEDEPVPVLLSVADWDTTAFPRLHEWLAARLEQDYPALRAAGLGPDVAQTLAGRGQILPILDGLDELPLTAQAPVITALNRSLGDEDQLILTSRTIEFDDAVQSAGDVLTSAVVIEPDPLDPATAADYLTRCLPPRPRPVWEQILTGLRTTPAPPAGPLAALAQITATPLGLWLVRAVYITPATDPTPLIDPGRFPDVPAMRAHLFDQLIEALITTRPSSPDRADLFRPRRDHDPTDVRRWLGYLAHHLSSTTAGDGTTGTRDFAWWQLARNTHALTRKTTLRLGLIVGLIYGLTNWLIFGLILAHQNGRIYGRAVGLVAGLYAGLTAGLVIGLRGTSWSQESPGFDDLRISGQLRQPANHLGAMLRTTLAIGLTATFAIGLATTLTAGLAIGLTIGLMFGLAAGLINWAGTPTRTGQASTPMTSWRADRALNMMRPAAFGLAIGLVFWLATGRTAGLTYVLAVGLMSGLASTPMTNWRADRALNMMHTAAFGLAIGLAFWLAFWLATGRKVGLPYVLAVGLMSGLASTMTSWRADRALNMMRTAAFGLAIGLAFWLTVWIAVWHATGRTAGLTYFLAVGLMSGLMSGLTCGLINWAETPARTGQASTPMTNWRADRALNMMRTATFGLAIGLAFWLASVLVFITLATDKLGQVLLAGLVNGLMGGLVFGVTFGLWPGKHHAWLAYLAATHRLARADRLPRRLMPFLDDAHRLGLLHAVGPRYQFRHAQLQDHLAATYVHKTRCGPQ